MLLCLQLGAQKIKGVCLVGPFEEAVDENPLGDALSLGADWLALSPEVSLDRKTLALQSNANTRDSWTLDRQGYKDMIAEAKKLSFKVFLKPHVVLSKSINTGDKIEEESSWRGNIEPKNPQDWITIENNYEAYILELANVAEEMGVDLFCIGTELKSFIAQRPYFWIDIIQKIRQTYSGPITYSANWDNFNQVTFWDDMDYIGLNAYFPIDESKYLSERKCLRSWQSIIEGIEGLSNKKQKQVIITEFGYRNVIYAGHEPWTHVGDGDIVLSDENQSILLAAFFASLWQESYVLGGFLWNWNYKTLMEGNTDFSVQNKPALNIVKREFEAASSR